MRRLILGSVLCVAMLVPSVVNAQASLRPTPPPLVTAANAVWQIRGEPVFYSGAFYYPTGPSVPFDGNVMVRTGTHEGIPLYADATMIPFSVVYVPIGGNIVRPYERRREGELVGTVGSRVPSFPIQRDGELAVATGTTGIITPPTNVLEPIVIPEAPRPVATDGTFTPSARAAVNAQVLVGTKGPGRDTRMETVLRPQLNKGLWLSWDGARWVSSGTAVSYSADRFMQIGEYRGFAVYRARAGSPDEIYVPAVAGGPLAPYKKDR